MDSICFHQFAAERWFYAQKIHQNLWWVFLVINVHIQDLAGFGVDLIFVFVLPMLKFHLINHHAVFFLQLAGQVTNICLRNACVVKGDLDIALIPANVASILYHKTQGGVEVIDINTLGVLYMVSGENDLADFTDLKGKTIYLTGKGTTPDYVLQYLLTANGMSVDDVTLEYKSEATEVASVLAEDPTAIGLLPQPFVTAACMQNDALKVIFDLNEEWNKIQGVSGSSMVTGVTVVRKEFLEEHEDAVKSFMEEHKASAEAINADPTTGAALAVEAQIVAKEPIAQKAIPGCNITYMDKADMKQALSGYLDVLFHQDSLSIGGGLPESDFYYDAE